MTDYLFQRTGKLLAINLLIILGAFFYNAPAKADELLMATLDTTNGVSLKSDIRVDTEFVTLGDLFHMADAKSDVNVVRAPKPGGKLTIPARPLARFLNRQGLIWENTMQLRHVMVSRNSTQVRETDIKAALQMAFEDMGLEEDIDIKLQNQNLTIHLPTKFVAELTVETLDHDPVSGRFSADIRTPLDNGESQVTRITGQTIEVKIIPILSRPIARNDIITAADLKTERIPVNRMGANLVSRMSDVVGMQTKRALRPGQPLRSTDLSTPTLVKKGALVTMTFSAPGMKLSNVGRALEAGGAGDIINVMNPRSKQTIMAEIIANNQVTVSIGSIQLASAAH